jgi:hypothetical protein
VAGRLHQGILIASVIVGSWFGMEVIHESGHVLGAWLSGGHVVRMVLDPRTISRTDVDPNPHPLVEVWAGPTFGVVAPVALWLLAAVLRVQSAFVFRFFAGFCLIVNGAYIGGGSFGRVGDCGVMLRNGSAIWQLWAFGIAAVFAGLWVWDGLAADFGIGRQRRPIARSTAYGCLAACVAIVALCALVGGR